MRSHELDGLHHRIWQAVSDFGIGLSEHYRTEMWIPHITLAEGDIDLRAAARIVERWSGNHFQRELKISNLAVLTAEAGRQEITLRYNFGNRS